MVRVTMPGTITADDALAQRAALHHDLRVARAEVEAARRMLAWRGLSRMERADWSVRRLRAQSRERDLIEQMRLQHAA